MGILDNGKHQYKYTNEREDRELKNLNNAVNDTAELIIPDFEGFNYFLQSFTLPSIDIPKVETPYMGNILNSMGDAVIYGDLIADFLVDEDLSNYINLFKWIKLQAHENNFVKKTVDITVLWKTRNLNVSRRITFVGAHITNLGSLTVVTNNTDQDVLICTATFAYQYYTIEGVSEKYPEAV